MKKKNRKHSIIDGLPSDLREAVDEMIKTDFTYHEIVEYIRKNGVEISVSSVQRYASNLNATLESLRLAQENFRAVAYKKKIDVDTKDVLENGADQFQSLIFEAMADEEPELYKRVKKFIKEKQS